ncbi:family 16 glycosylhydrolase [Emticicia sp. BO119]|uniref:glycoside hydrolase family 16 protein n=1 Tax=Emticicia sp. BO119 TaxID=2757768 RepID=UPI0015F0030C|nr:glycoside hydrolase family 16 protein [Emticicia sp. BO119]MBA4848842.1 glycoside hydrolase family 16 protein [Emticicia sp. BO119]
MKKLTAALILLLSCQPVMAQQSNPFEPDFSEPEEITGMKLVWNDEFNTNGKPDPQYWRYEKGFVRNQETQWYQQDNATIKDGVLLIEGRKEAIKNPNYEAGSNDWRKNREYSEYTSSSIQTRGFKQFWFGRVEVRARIDTAMGSWPAIWTLGVSKPWPSNGEIDIMEFYRVKGVPTILANTAWGTETPYKARWDDQKIPLTHFTAKDKDWVKKFHIWRMDWDKDKINLYLDDELLNTTLLSETINADGSNGFLQEHYLLLNLAIGGVNGGKAVNNQIKYEVDYVRVYQKAD